MHQKKLSTTSEFCVDTLRLEGPQHTTCDTSPSELSSWPLVKVAICFTMNRRLGEGIRSQGIVCLGSRRRMTRILYILFHLAVMAYQSILAAGGKPYF